MIIKLQSVGNPDLGQYTPPAPKVDVPVRTFAEASLVLQRYIEAYALGGGNLPSIFVFKGKKKVARVSYNGRVWAPKDGGALLEEACCDLTFPVDADGVVVPGAVIAWMEQLEQRAAIAKLTAVNLRALTAVFIQADEVPNRVERVHLSHLKRCFAAGLLEHGADKTTLRLTAAGRDLVQGARKVVKA